MKHTFSRIGLLAILITDFGNLVDGDVEELSLTLKLAEFVAMTAIVFSMVTFVYYAGVFVFRSVLKRFGD